MVAFPNKTIRYFSGRPDAGMLEPGQIGINIEWLNDLKENRPPKNKNFIPVLEEILKEPQKNLTVLQTDVIAERLKLDRTTVGRAKRRLEEFGVLYHVHFNGGYAISPDLIAITDENGKAIEAADPLYRKNRKRTFR